MICGREGEQCSDGDFFWGWCFGRQGVWGNKAWSGGYYEAMILRARAGQRQSRPLTVSVVGEVVRPSVVTLDPGAGVLQALAAAGGLTDFAQREGIFVLRKPGPDVAPVRIRFTWAALTRGETKAARFALAPQDIIVAE